MSSACFLLPNEVLEGVGDTHIGFFFSAGPNMPESMSLKLTSIFLNARLEMISKRAWRVRAPQIHHGALIELTFAKFNARYPGALRELAR